jgi:hypothetical protein
MRHLGVIVLAPSIRGFRGLGIPIRARFGVLTRRYCAFWSACCGQRPRATFEGGYSASSANTARPVPRRTFATLLFRFAFWFSSWAHLISQTWPVSQKRMVSRPPDTTASRQGSEFPPFDIYGHEGRRVPLTNESSARHQFEVRRRSGPYSRARLLALTPDSAHRIWPRSFRDRLHYHRDVLDADGVTPDAHAGGVPNRVGDRTDCTGDADLADALHAKRVDMGIVFMDEDSLH